MKLSIAIAAISLSACVMAQSTQAGSSKVFNTSGAYVYMSTPGGSGSQIWLYASHADRPEVSTFIQFDIFTPNPDGTFTDTFGFGEVPGDVITGNTTSKLTLNVDTSQASSFETRTCRSDGVCQQGPFGLIQIDFTADGDYSARSVSESQYEFFQITQHSHYNTRYVTALANGSILGNSVNNGSSDIGTNRSTTITLTRKR